MKIGYDHVGITTPFYCHDGKGNLLMHKRSKECRDEHHRWDSGSGKLEFNLFLEENVLQEILEEYGCKGEIEERLPTHDIFRTFDGVKTHWIAIPFFVKVNRDEVKNNEPHKIEEIGLFKIDNLPQPLHSGFEYSFNYCKSYFVKYLKS
ncbi:MAG: NUDIX domain-containing protein [Minisyncoccia bacterium]